VNLIILLAGAVLFMFALIRKPELIAVVLFTLIIARVNFDLKGLPLNLRAIMSLALFARIMADKSSQKDYPAFLNVPSVKVLILFLVYVIFVSFSQDLFTVDLLKESISTVITTFCVYYFFFKSGNANQLKSALIAAGLICFADLAYTYIVFGTFPVHRIYFQFTGLDNNLSDEEMDLLTNWNFFGQICGICFVYSLSDYIRNRASGKFILWVLPIMFLGVLMSTSRSSILALLIVSIIIILNGINFQEQKKRISRIGSFSLGAVLMAFLLFATFGKYLNLDSKFVDEIISRMAQEPIAVLNRAMGNSYDIHNLGSMDWREESSENAYAAYMNMNFREQLFGIGSGGFEARNYGHGYNAHNAILLLLIENGIIGFGIYILLVGGNLVQCIIKKNISPPFAAVCFILIYGLGQNREWTSITTLLFVINMAAELRMLRLIKYSINNETVQNSPTVLIKKANSL
jgi:O-antigen ligase